MSQRVAKTRNIDEKRLSILDLNEDCQLEIMKYIIAGCNCIDSSKPSKYADMENFAMAVESTKELLRIHHKEIYYHRELTEVAKKGFLRINFSELQSTIANKNEGDAYWKLYAKAIRNNNDIKSVILTRDTSSSYPEFSEHFETVIGALENKKNLTELVLDLKEVRMSAETLVSVCRSAPKLYVLKIISADIKGRLSDIVPHCSKLQHLTFVPKPNVDGTEYAPLVELPHLSEITIHGAYKNGSLLTMFQAMKDCRRDENSPLTVSFTDVLPPSSSVTMARVNSMKFLSNALDNSSDRIELKTSYNWFEISGDGRPIEESLVSMNLFAFSFEVDFVWKKLILQKCLVSDVDNLITVLKQFNVNNLTTIVDYRTLFPKLFNSLIPDGLYGLKSICINDEDENTGTMQLIDQLTIRELVKIKSITFLQCSFADWESVELLSELTNLQTLNIKMARKFEKKYAKELCNLLNTSSVSTFIHCYDWIIEFQKNAGIPGPTNNGVNTLKIFYLSVRETLNELFEALSYRNFNANEELFISDNNLKCIHKVSEIKTLKKLNISLFSDANGIEKLSELTELEELTITLTTNNSLIKLFDQLASNESSPLQCLRLRLKQISHNELFMLSRIRSLKKLNLFVSDTASCASLTELANSNIEDLEISVPHLSLKKLLPAFAERKTTRLRHLKSFSNRLDLMELTELSKLQDLISLHILSYSSEMLSCLQQLNNLKKLAIPDLIFFWNFTSLVELKNLESLTLSSCNADILPFLCNTRGLKELIIEETNSSLSRVYRSQVLNDLKLELLNVPIYCLDELEGITKMKSLKKLVICFTFEIYSNPNQPLELGQLTDLEFLYIKTEGVEFELWSLIFKSCKNISICTIDGLFDKYDNFVGKVHTLIKSIRDPAIQDPLLLTVIVNIKSGDDEIDHLEYIDDAYLKVYYSIINYSKTHI